MGKVEGLRCFETLVSLLISKVTQTTTLMRRLFNQMGLHGDSHVFMVILRRLFGTVHGLCCDSYGLLVIHYGWLLAISMK